ncbi:RAMP superfamily CRISPR-associated protein [Desulfococcaceae bacterium HSG8]|nr:RAMP superfamily CRISPR-associated protein [Desulfococcaceae bacterium HSG8]
MRHNLKLKLTISFKSKWHAGSGEGGFLLDRLIRKDARNLPYIPGSTLKGVVRENCEKLSRTLGFPEPLDPHETEKFSKASPNETEDFSEASPNETEDFSKASPNETEKFSEASPETEDFSEAFAPLNKLRSPVDRIFGNKYQSGNLFFRDARLKDKHKPHRLTREQSRICSYRKLRTAREQHLFSTQYAAPMKFQTRIDGYHDDLFCLDEGDPPYAYCLLIAAIMATDRIGGDKSTGSGQVEISFNTLKYNGEDIPAESVFEYLDSDFYEMSKEEGS